MGHAVKIQSAPTPLVARLHVDLMRVAADCCR
jgi:hypothetical protein